MSENQEKLSAEAILNGLAEVLAELELSVQQDRCDPGDEAFLARAMRLVNDWRRRVKFDQAREKRKLFQKLRDRIANLTAPSEIRRTIEDTLRPAELEQRLVFNRRLAKLTDADLNSLKTEEKLLEFWSYFDADQDEDA